MSYHTTTPSSESVESLRASAPFQALLAGLDRVGCGQDQDRRVDAAVLTAPARDDGFWTLSIGNHSHWHSAYPRDIIEEALRQVVYRYEHPPVGGRRRR